MAGVLFGGEGAALSLEAAAARFGIWKRPSARLSVVCRRSRNTRPPRWLHLWRSTTLTIADLIVVDSIRCTNVVRTICDLGRVLTSWQLANVLYEARFRGMLNLGALCAANDARRGQAGSAVVRRAIELHLAGSAGTRSRSEDRLLMRILLELLPEPRVNQRGATGVGGFECDFVWPEFRLVVEVDGRPFHDGPGSELGDPVRDALLRAAGWHVLRFDANRVWDDLDGVIRAIRHAMRLALV